MQLLKERNVACDVVEYLKKPLTKAELSRLLAALEDPPEQLVRKDKYFKELGLRPQDYRTKEQVARLLAEHPRLMERPVVVRGRRALIARPPERALELLE
ncbi:MAG: arsenate reductase [Candidatus Dadabacteria bacterium]|nr:MAG: arsenate reductase [Candidatus Dadabacteria bacterium]